MWRISQKGKGCRKKNKEGARRPLGREIRTKRFVIFARRVVSPARLTYSLLVWANQTCLGALWRIALGLVVVSRRLKHATSHCRWRFKPVGFIFDLGGSPGEKLWNAGCLMYVFLVETLECWMSDEFLAQSDGMLDVWSIRGGRK